MPNIFDQISDSDLLTQPQAPNGSQDQASAASVAPADAGFIEKSAKAPTLNVFDMIPDAQLKPAPVQSDIPARSFLGNLTSSFGAKLHSAWDNTLAGIDAYKNHASDVLWSDMQYAAEQDAQRKASWAQMEADSTPRGTPEHDEAVKRAAAAVHESNLVTGQTQSGLNQDWAGATDERQDAKDVWKDSKVDPNAKDWGSQIGRGLGGSVMPAATMFTGPFAIPLALAQTSAETYSETYTATEDKLKAAGVANKEDIAKAASEAASDAALKSVPKTAAFVGAGKIFSKVGGAVVDKVTDGAATPIQKALGGFGAALFGNITTGSVLRALDGDDWKPTLESLTGDTLWAIVHGTGEYSQASGVAKSLAQAELQKRAVASRVEQDAAAQADALKTQGFPQSADATAKVAAQRAAGIRNFPIVHPDIEIAARQKQLDAMPADADPSIRQAVQDRIQELTKLGAKAPEISPARPELNKDNQELLPTTQPEPSREDLYNHMAPDERTTALTGTDAEQKAVFDAARGRWQEAQDAPRRAQFASGSPLADREVAATQPAKPDTSLPIPAPAAEPSLTKPTQERMTPESEQEFQGWAQNRDTQDLQTLKDDHLQDPTRQSDHAVELINAELQRRGESPDVPAPHIEPAPVPEPVQPASPRAKIVSKVLTNQGVEADVAQHFANLIDRSVGDVPTEQLRETAIGEFRKLGGKFPHEAPEANHSTDPTSYMAQGVPEPQAIEHAENAAYWRKQAAAKAAEANRALLDKLPKDIKISPEVDATPAHTQATERTAATEEIKTPNEKGPDHAPDNQSESVQGNDGEERTTGAAKDAGAEDRQAAEVKNAAADEPTKAVAFKEQTEPSPPEEEPTAEQRAADKKAAGLVKADDAEPVAALPSEDQSWINSTFEGVKEILGKKGVDPEKVGFTRAVVTKLANTIRSFHSSYGNSSDELLDVARQTVRNDLLKNAEERGKPMTSTTKDGKEVSYSAVARLRQAVGNARRKLGREVKGEASDLTLDKAAEGNGGGNNFVQDGRANDAEHVLQQKLSEGGRVDAARAAKEAMPKAVADFVRDVKAPKAAPDATREQIQRATMMVLADLTGTDLGGEVNKAGKPGPAQKLASDLEFQSQVKEQILGRIREILKGQMDKGILESFADSPESFPAELMIELLPKEVSDRIKTNVSDLKLREGSGSIFSNVAKLKGISPLAKALAKAFEKSGISFHTVVDPLLRERNLKGEFNPATRRISIDPLLDRATAIWTVLHEHAHGILNSKITTFLSGGVNLDTLDERDRAALTDLEALRNEALASKNVPDSIREVASKPTLEEQKKAFGALFKQDPSVRQFYGLINLHEFASETLSNGKFQDFLSGLKSQVEVSKVAPEKVGVWQRVKDTMRKLLFNGQTVAEDSSLAKAFDRVIDLAQTGSFERQWGGDHFDAPTEDAATNAFAVDMKNQRQFLQDWAKEHGHSSPQEMLQNDPESLQRGMELYRVLHPRADLGEGTTLGSFADLMHTARLKFQDKFIDLEEVQKEIEKTTGAPLPDTSNTYQAQEIYHGIVGHKVDELYREHLEPLVKAIKAYGFTVSEVNKYLYARHAEERNAQIAKINPKLPDGGSGMTNLEAQTILADFNRQGKTAKLDLLAARVDKVLADALRSRLDSGLIDQATHDHLEKFYQNYVPLKGREGAPAGDDEFPDQHIGGGFDIRGQEIRRALGRSEAAGDILANVFGDAAETIVRSEKNKVGQNFLELVKAANRPDVFEVAKPQFMHVLKNGKVVDVIDPRWMQQPNIMALKVNGETKFIDIKHDSIQRAFKNAGVGTQNIVVSALRSVNHFLAAMNTHLAPEFILSNFVKDLQEAGINLGDNSVSKTVGGKTKNLRDAILRDALNGTALKAAFDGLGGKRGTAWTDAFHEMSEHGGRMIFFGQTDAEAMAKKISNLAAEHGPAVTKLLAFKNGLLHMIERTNGAVENGIRLATYFHARQAGISPDRAGHIARNITINFTRKGEYGSLMNSLFLFSNASLQGTARVFTGAAKSPKIRATLAGAAGLGFAMDLVNRQAGGKDDDGVPYWDKVPDQTRNTNFVLMLPGTKGKYLRFPLPHGYNVAYVAGRNMASAAPTNFGGQGVHPLAAAGATLEAAVNAFNPIGGGSSILPALQKGDGKAVAQSLVRMVSPTALGLLLDPAFNKDYADRPIKPEPGAFEKYPLPESERYWPSVSTESKWVTDHLNSLTGGNRIRPGLISFSPEYLDYGVDNVLGGLGSFGKRIVNLGLKATGQGGDRELQANDIPMVRKFVGDVPSAATMQRYYDLRTAAYQAEAEVKSLAQTGDADGARNAAKDGADFLHALAVVKATDEKLTGLRGAVRKLRDAQDSGKAKGREDQVSSAIQKLQDDMLVQAKAALKVYETKRRK